MPTICAQCGLRALLGGEPAPTFDESSEAHQARVHPASDTNDYQYRQLIAAVWTLDESGWLNIEWGLMEQGFRRDVTPEAAKPFIVLRQFLSNGRQRREAALARKAAAFVAAAQAAAFGTTERTAAAAPRATPAIKPRTAPWLRNAAKQLMEAGEYIKNGGDLRIRTASAMREVRIDHFDIRAAIASLERQLIEQRGELRGQRDEIRHLREHVEQRNEHGKI